MVKTPSFSPGCLEPFAMDDKDWRKTMISEMPKKKHGRKSVRYSHLIGNEWERASLDDPDLFDRLLSAAKRAQLPLRDKLIVLMACRCGVWVRDILRLAIGDWRACGCRLEIRGHRQASRGQVVGMLRLPPDTASLPHPDTHAERNEYEPAHLDFLQPPATDPSLLTTTSTA